MKYLLCILGIIYSSVILPQNALYQTEPLVISIGPLVNGFALISKNGKFGFADKHNRIVIYPIYNEALNFSEKLAAVKYEGKWGFIDEIGKWIIPPRYENVKNFHEGYAAVEVGGKWGFVNVKGDYLVAPQFEEVLNFSEGLAPVCVKREPNKWGYINRTGRMVIAPIYSSASMHINGLSVVVFSNENGIINKIGNYECQEKWSPEVYKNLRDAIIEKQNAKMFFSKESQIMNQIEIQTLETYISYNVPSWNLYLQGKIEPVDNYENFLKYHVEKDINFWQQKGEFEPTSKWKERVNEETRRNKIKELTVKYRNVYEVKTLAYKKRYEELKKEYELEYNKSRDEYYTLVSQSKEKEFRQANFELMPYDADNQSFMIKSDKRGDILMPVPLEEAPSFKQNWNTIKNTITPTFVPSGDDVVLTSVAVTNGKKKYIYDSHTQAKYAVTDINYNFDPVEISIPDVADVNYTFDSVEVIQSTVVQTTPKVKGLQANNATIERKSIDATKQSDVDINIPQNTIQKNSNTFVVIIANENYQRVSDVQYANNDGKLFAEYCQKTLGLPQNHVMVYNDATLGNMLGAINRIKEIGEAYNGKVNVVFCLVLK